ncbi:MULTISPECIES: hypothetical protein [unclassified Klebsiella]
MVCQRSCFDFHIFNSK